MATGPSFTEPVRLDAEEKETQGESVAQKDASPSSSPTHSLHEDVQSHGSEIELATKERSDGKRELTEDDCYDKLGFSFPTWRKWTILTVIFAVQMSMNFNTSVYPNVVPPLADHFGISEQAARCGQMSFLVAYGSLFIAHPFHRS
jgi:hypothetical protein